MKKIIKDYFSSECNVCGMIYEELLDTESPYPINICYMCENEYTNKHINNIMKIKRRDIKIKKILNL